MKKLLRFAGLIICLSASVGNLSADQLKPFGRGEWQKILKAHEGRPFIVHFWGLACGPCRKELAGWGDLLAEQPDLSLVTVNADIVPDPQEAANDFLEKSGLSLADNWIFEDRFQERLRYEIDPQWQGEIPVTWLISKSGATSKIEGAAQMQDVRTWIAGSHADLR